MKILQIWARVRRQSKMYWKAIKIFDSAAEKFKEYDLVTMNRMIRS